MLRLFLVILSLVSTLVLPAQSLMHVRNYSAKDGLSQNTVADFLQDDTGLIWMATWNGLEKFDGYTFQNYKSYPEDDTRLEYNRIRQISKSKRGNIWCVTYNHLLYLFDTRTEKFRDIFSECSTPSGYGEVARMYRQADGILWFSNKAGDLWRIDEDRLGETDGIVHLPCHSRTVHGQTIYAVYHDRRGYEWVLTDRGTFVHNHPEVETGVRLRYVKEADGATYFLTGDGELYTFVQESGIRHIRNTFPMKPSTGLVAMKSGRLLIPDSEKILVYDARKQRFEQLFRRGEADEPLHVTSVHHSGRGEDIWMLSGRQVLRYTPSDGKMALYRENLEGGDAFRYVHEDEFGGIRLVTRNGLFYSYHPEADRLEPAYRYATGRKELYRTEGGAFLQDSHQNLWVSRRYGFDKIYFTHRNYDYISSSAEQEVRGVFVDSKKRLWVASRENRLEVYDEHGRYLGNMDSGGRLLKDRHLSFGRNVYSFFEDDEQRIWLGTRNHGIVVATEHKGAFALRIFRHSGQDPYSLSHDAVYSMGTDTKGRIWIGTLGGGINLFDGTLEHPRFIHAGNRLKGYPDGKCRKVRSLYCTRKGVMLAGTTEGLLSFSDDFRQPEEILFYHNDCADGLSNNDVMDVLESRDGNVYVAAYSGGICMAGADSLLDTRIQFRYLNMTNGLPSDLPQSMLEDREGNIWICFENYIGKYRADREGVDTYGSANLHTDLQITEAHPTIDRQSMYIGTNQGVLRLRLYDLKKSDFVPRIVYTGADIRKEDGTASSVVLTTDSLVLGKRERNVTIDFSALDYTNSEALRYAYRMRGISDQWGDIGENHSIGFANLPSGDFVLEVKSTNGDGAWCDNVTPLYIHVRPRFAETMWAWVLYTLLVAVVILTVSGIIIYITNLKRKVVLEQQLTDLKLRFFTDISHELRTPLTLISGSIEEIATHGQMKEEGVENLQVARRNVNRMLRLVNQILDFRKIQGQKMKLNIEQGDAVTLCRQVCDNFAQLANERSIRLDLVPETAEMRCYVDVDKLEKILFNLLSNAFKYTADGTSIIVTVAMESGCLSLSVCDEGKGMDLRKIDHLFGRFETFGKTDPKRSTGIGLSLVKEFVDLLHGTIQVESFPGQGTTFTIVLPCTYEAYSADAKAEFILSDSMKNEWPETVASRPVREQERSVLVVEDNDELRRFLVMILGNNYNVLEAADGKQGMEMVGRELPDLIVSDVMMPEMDGIQLLEAVKANRDTSHIPVILLSAKASVDDRVKGLEYGADDYIAKPFSSAYLKARIESLIKQRSMLAAYYLGKEDKDEKRTERERADVGAEQAPVSVPVLDERFIREVIRLVDENLQNSDFKIDDLAETMNMSRAVFYRKIKMFTGTSPIELVKEMRLKRALALLDAGGYSLTEVAYQSGFSSPQYFSRFFKEQMRCTPNEYKRRKETQGDVSNPFR